MEHQGRRIQLVSNPFSLLIGRNVLRQLWQRKERPPNENSWPSSRSEQWLESTIFEDILDTGLEDTENIYWYRRIVDLDHFQW